MNQAFTVDPYYLLTCNQQQLTREQFDNEVELMQLASNGMGQLILLLDTLPTQQEGSSYVMVLPPPTTVLPREKPLPKPKPLTRWQKFAQEKGIRKRKKSRLLWDEDTQSYRPRRFVKGKQPAIIPAKPGKDDFEGAVDPFTRAVREKKERIRKNQARQLKNIQYNQKQAAKQQLAEAAEGKRARRR